MSDEVKPALTPEEWEGPLRVERHDWAAQVKRRSDGTHRIYFDVGELWHPVDEPESLHALAALALHGQHFGFGWEDVRLLQNVIDSNVYIQAHPPETIRRLRSLADRIAALLPPRE